MIPKVDADSQIFSAEVFDYAVQLIMLERNGLRLDQSLDIVFQLHKTLGFVNEFKDFPNEIFFV